MTVAFEYFIHLSLSFFFKSVNIVPYITIQYFVLNTETGHKDLYIKKKSYDLSWQYEKLTSVEEMGINQQ